MSKPRCLSQGKNPRKHPLTQKFHAIGRWQGTRQVEEELARWRRLFLIATALTVPVFLLTVVFPMVPATRAALAHSVLGFPLTPLLKWAFTTPVQVQPLSLSCLHFVTP